jgi:hypothetical protein
MFKRSSRPAGKLKVRNSSKNSEIKNIETPLPLPNKLKGEVTIIRKSDPIIQKTNNRLKKLDVIIISVNYNDYLLVSLSHNIKIFENITVVTSSDDLMCQKICDKFGVNCIITDVMYENGAKFNKGKAINKGIESINDPDFILLLDADIIVNSGINIDELVEDELSRSTSWGCRCPKRWPLNIAAPLTGGAPIRLALSRCFAAIPALCRSARSWRCFSFSLRFTPRSGPFGARPISDGPRRWWA